MWFYSCLCSGHYSDLQARKRHVCLALKLSCAALQLRCKLCKSHRTEYPLSAIIGKHSLKMLCNEYFDCSVRFYDKSETSGCIWSFCFRSNWQNWGFQEEAAHSDIPAQSLWFLRQDEKDLKTLPLYLNSLCRKMGFFLLPSNEWMTHTNLTVNRTSSWVFGLKAAL